MQRKTPAALRSARWFAPDDFRSFGHRSRVRQANDGCDFDFLETAFGAAVAESDIY